MSLAMALGMAAAMAGSESHLCSASVVSSDGQTFGFITLWSDTDYIPTRMKMLWQRRNGDHVDLAFDPRERTAPPRIAGADFRIPISHEPRFPITVTVYAGGEARWVSRFNAAEWRQEISGERATRSLKLWLGTADDRKEVASADLQAIATDARGATIGKGSFLLPDLSAPAFIEARERIEREFLAHDCPAPPPRID